MKHQQVFVRATNSKGKWINCDALDLDDESFKAFVMDRLFKFGLVTGIKDEMLEGEDINYRAKKGSESDKED